MRGACEDSRHEQENEHNSEAFEAVVRARAVLMHRVDAKRVMRARIQVANLR
jgi:hypothetical protein